MDRLQRFSIGALLIVLVAGLILVRLMLDLNDLRRQINTQHVLEHVARQVEMFRSARGFLPAGLDEFVVEVPDGFSDLEGGVIDGWGNSILYYSTGQGRNEQYLLASPGRDGDFDQPPGQYLGRRGFASNRGHPDRDTVLVGGRLVQGPEEAGKR
jgi:hypothetical protein